MVDIATLRAQAEQIRNETTLRANTANRVGSALLSIVNSLEPVVTAGMTAGDAAVSGANAAALQAALTAASSSRSRVVVPPGYYYLSQQVSLPDGAFCDLYISEGATLDFTLLTTLPSREAAITIGTDAGGLTALPGLGANATKGDNQVTFASPPNLVAGDLFILWNNDAQSWNTNLIDSRPYYHAGEYLRVRSVSGSVVQLDRALYDTYLTSQNIDMVKVTTCNVRISGGGRIVGAATALLDVGIQLWNAYRSEVSNITITGCLYCGINAWRCYDTVIRDVNVFECSSADDNAGLFMLSSFNTWVVGGNYRAGKHGVSLTGGNVASSIPNRLCGASGTKISADTQAADMHGHCDRCFWIDCIVDGGMALGGSNCAIYGGSVRSASDATATLNFKGHCVRFREMKNAAHTIDGLTVFLDSLSVQSGGSYPLTLDTFEAIEGGTVVVRNLKVKATVHNAKLMYLAIQPASGGLVEFDLDGVVYDGVAGNKAPAIVMFGTTSASFKRISLRNIAGLTTSCDTVRAKLVNYRDLDISESDNFGIEAVLSYFSGVRQYVNVINCVTSRNDAAGIFISGSTGTNEVYATVRGCQSVDNGQDVTEAGSSRSSLRAIALRSLELSGNTWGDTQASGTQVSLYSVASTADLLGSGNKTIGATGLLRSVSVTNDREELTFSGLGSPEGAYVAPVGARYINCSGGATGTFYVKGTGSGATGWFAK